MGRITEVLQKSWRVDLNGRNDAVLMLSAINLPGGVLVHFINFKINILEKKINFR